MLNSLDNILQNILLSHVVVKETSNDNNKTLIRIHLIPLNNKITIFKETRSKIKNKRNKHVSHLPKYKKITGSFNKSDLEDGDIEESSPCSICLSEFKQGEFSRKLPICNHVYHKGCIDKWFLKDKHMKCPICRASHTKEKWNEFLNK